MLQAGTLLEDKYRLVQRIGQGAMGSVWRAEHVKLGRGIAIKFVLAQHDAEAVARFLREARIAARIRHRHVVSITDFGSTGDGQPYIVMELLDGESLDKRLARTPRIPVHELFEYAAGALSGLEAVHAAGIIHRDLKPANIFLVREVDGIVPKIVDFGTSRATAQAAPIAGTETITTAGMIVGTPYYMSEEQVRGRRDIDARTDLYSLGVILYEALSGKVPFDADTMHALAVEIATAQPAPLGHLRPDLPAEVIAVVEKAMARDRSARYQTARELRRALLATIGVSSSETIPQTAVLSQPCLPAIPSQASAATEISMALTGPVSPQPTIGDHYTLVRHSREPRRRWPVAALAVVVLFACAGGGLALALRDTRAAPPDVVRPLPSPPPSLGPSLPPPSSLGPSPPPPAAPVVRARVASPVAARAASAEVAPVAARAGLGAHVTVRLLDLPDGGLVRVDGQVVSGPELRLPRDGQLRRIEVSASGRGSWSTEHGCGADGEYRVEIASSADAQAVRSPGPPTGAPRAARDPGAAEPTRRPRSEPEPGALLGDPGF
ncbi:MAG: serine/threonine protein kinase [Deltaproteobacteria bacterium]|nr:serine/threonine protein kinase [Deltaproteobacteria bacterium]